MSDLRAVAAATLVAGAMASAGCSDERAVQIVQGDFLQTVTSFSLCEKDNVFDRACSRRAYPQTALEGAFDPSAPATVAFPEAARVEISLLREAPGRQREQVAWEDEVQCIDSACASEIPLNRRVTERLPGPYFLRVVIFSDQARGFELRLDPR
jgi:hypothetical protein